MTTVALSEFLRDRTQHITHCTNSVVELAAPWIHYESQDTCLTVFGCLDWRGEILMSALDAHSRAPDIAVGAVHFLILQLGHEPVAEVLAYYGERAAAFAELFDDKWLVGDLDENDHFTAGMPIRRCPPGPGRHDGPPHAREPASGVGGGPHRSHDAADHRGARGNVVVRAAVIRKPARTPARLDRPRRPGLATRRLHQHPRPPTVLWASNRVHISRRREGRAG
ncbi:hypothetical protein [Mycolicibacterium tusciae]|uniref:hypothetical protein n=1 Tax=Mycolicibacterium tusciae TaxID=75922 RepID=UPI0002FCC768|nr:hypothetical protein [Mycolicibacterium tusciae]